MTLRITCAALALVVTGIAIARPLGYSSAPIGPDLEQAGWQLIAFSGKPATRFAGKPDGSIEVVAERSVAFLYRDVSALSGHQRYLFWRWRVDETIPATDLSRKGQDDRPLALHLSFPGDRRNSLWQSLRRMLVDVPLSGKVITYVWGGAGRRGDRLQNPYLRRDGVLYILRPSDAPTGQWFTEKIDIDADFSRAFGYSAPSPMYVLLSADTDDTASRSMGSIADIVFTDR